MIANIQLKWISEQVIGKNSVRKYGGDNCSSFSGDPRSAGDKMRVSQGIKGLVDSELGENDGKDQGMITVGEQKASRA